MASTSSPGYLSRYDVFLSFQGETRHGFTDHLYEKLGKAGVYTFRDNNDIPRGEDLKPEIKRGIRESRASVIVLSKSYATSRWCLDELYLILKQRKKRNHFVLPIFYHVDPSDIRKREGTFKIEVKNGTKWTQDNVNRWNKALKKVGNLTGKVLPGRQSQDINSSCLATIDGTMAPIVQMDGSEGSSDMSEADFSLEIVSIIKETLNLTQVYRQPNLVGMETRDKEINSWLDQSDGEILAIWGMDGGGKTTLARHIVYSNFQKFESACIIEDIGSRSTEELRQLQQKLIRDIIEGKEKTIPSVWEGTCTIENALKRKKAIIVLDNIVTKKHLDALLGTGTKTKSKIIITVTEKDASKWFQSTSWSCKEHEIKLLDDVDSLKLLKLHAFDTNVPTEGYEELAEKVLPYCQGNPLALEVLGSSLKGDTKREIWESRLRALMKRELHRDIKNVLRIRYDWLPLGSEKDLFLHIACFFIGRNKDYVERILEPDYSAKSGIVTLTNSCLLSVSPNNELMMHRLLQEMGRTIVLEESPQRPGKRTRVWQNEDSHNVLSNRKGSTKVEGLALDMEILSQEHELCKHEISDLKTDTFKKMKNLKLLQLNQLKLKNGPYDNFSKDLRWLCWREFHLRKIPPELYMGKLVAIDMSCSKLQVFEPPKVLPSLKILNLADSHDLVEIRNISRVPKLETLILSKCCSLVHIYDSFQELRSLSLLNITGCEKLCKREQPKMYEKMKISVVGGNKTESSFLFPNSLERLYLNDCNLEDNGYFPLRLKDQSLLEYLNLANNQFKLLPCYSHLKNLRVLDLSFCRKIKMILCLPRRLAELYIFYCESLEIVTFESHKYTLQEFRYKGCVNLSEVEDFFQLIPVTKLKETDLGCMKWLTEYQDREVCLVGDGEVTKGRSFCLQMLREFNIMSISLPSIEKPNLIPEYMYTSEYPVLSFDVPNCTKNRTLKGLNITFKYTMQGDDGWEWFAKIRTDNGVDLMYNAKVFGRTVSDEVGIWLSYWPIGNSLHVGDEVTVNIIVMKGLEIKGCGASLVYADEEDEYDSLTDRDEFVDANESFEDHNKSHEDKNESVEDNNKHADILGGDISGFKLSTGTYYLCRRDYCRLMEVGRLTPNWFKNLDGDKNDYTEIGGWRKTGRPDQPYRSYTKLKTVECIIYGPQLKEFYAIGELSKSSLVDKTEEFTSDFSKDETKDVASNEWMMFPSMMFPSSSLIEKKEYTENRQIVLTLRMSNVKEERKVLKMVTRLDGVASVSFIKDGVLKVTGYVDPVTIVSLLRKKYYTEVITVEPNLEKGKSTQEDKT